MVKHTREVNTRDDGRPRAPCECRVTRPIHELLGLPDGGLVREVEHQVNEKVEVCGLEDLTDVELNVLRLATLRGELLNGGLEQFFFNHGDDIEETLYALSLVGPSSLQSA